jgi:hypothetical protein
MDRSPFAVDFSAVQPLRFTTGGTLTPPKSDDVKGDTATQKAGQTFLASVQRRRMAGIKRAAELLDHLPNEGESLHCLLLGYFDLCNLLLAFLERVGMPCDVLRIATLSASKRNVSELAALLDSGAVRRLDFLTSDFQKEHDTDIFEMAISELSVKRGQKVAAARSHCKLITLTFENDRRYVFHGSANLRTSRNSENVTLCRSAEVHGFYDTYLADVVKAHEVKQTDDCPQN